MTHALAPAHNGSGLRNQTPNPCTHISTHQHIGERGGGGGDCPQLPTCPQCIAGRTPKMQSPNLLRHTHSRKLLSCIHPTNPNTHSHKRTDRPHTHLPPLHTHWRSTGQLAQVGQPADHAQLTELAVNRQVSQPCQLLQRGRQRGRQRVGAAAQGAAPDGDGQRLSQQAQGKAWVY